MSVVMPHVLHFLGNLRKLCLSSAKRRKVKIHQLHATDLDLMLTFLRKAHEGISLNLITFRQPSHVYFSDACPAGIGGYNHLGYAWRWKIPDELMNRATINMLEHIAATIGPWIDLLNSRLPEESCILSMTDSTTSAGWLRKSNFSDPGDTKFQMKAKMEASR